ncbi:MAG TPA: ACT domain-containing protein [Terriglobia bacterium]|nr:ACT domain-containing protein [Terriglobia bacterium]
MADTIRSVDYFKLMIPNQPGAACGILDHFKAAGVNLLAFTGFPVGRKAQLDFVPADTKAFLAAAKKAKLRVGRAKSGFLVQGEDRVGAVCDVLAKLARHKINVTAVDAVSAGGGRYGTILWVKPKDQARAAKALGA